MSAVAILSKTLDLVKRKSQIIICSKLKIIKKKKTKQQKNQQIKQ